LERFEAKNGPQPSFGFDQEYLHRIQEYPRWVRVLSLTVKKSILCMTSDVSRESIRVAA
jgi:hypothetical protein